SPACSIDASRRPGAYPAPSVAAGRWCFDKRSSQSMPEIISLSAEPRERAGKGATRAMRRAGRVPAIVYGDGKEPALISLEPRQLTRALHRPGFFNHLVEISVDGTTHRTPPRE